MVTSRGERIDRVRGFDAGVDEYITKPHDRQLLLRAVRKLLGHAARAPTTESQRRERRRSSPTSRCSPTLVRRPLEPLGHRRHRASTSVAELEARLDELAPRAVLLPRRLPDRALADAVAMLRARARARRSRRSSSGSPPRDRDVARDVDADGFLLVPFTDAEVLDVLGATTRDEEADPPRRRLAADPPPHRADPRGRRLRGDLGATTAPRRSRMVARAPPRPGDHRRRDAASSTATACARRSRATPPPRTCRC